jgi:hypothetical protein
MQKEGKGKFLKTAKNHTDAETIYMWFPLERNKFKKRDEAQACHYLL